LRENESVRLLVACVSFLPLLPAGLSAQTVSRTSIQPPARVRTVHVVPARGPLSAARYDWLQFNFDERHSGNDTAEAILSRDNVARLARLFAVPLPDVADGAPAVLTAVATLTGTRDLLFVTTRSGTTLALDARNGSAIWTRQPATGPQYTTCSPAVDPARQYVYAYGLEGFVHKYAVADGTEATGAWPQLATLKPDVEKGSSALSIARVFGGQTFLYVSNGGYPGDAGDYQGHVTAINLTSGSQKVFNTACSDKTIHFVENGGSENDCPHKQTAVWARPGVVYDAASDRIYFATGNGDFDGNLGGKDWGDSVLAIAEDGSGANGEPIDSYTPVNFQALQNSDADLGSAAPAILPAPSASRFRALAVQAGKDANLRLLALDNLSQQGGPGHIGGELQILRVPQGGQVLTQPAVWVNPVDTSIWLFVVTAAGASGLTLTTDSSGIPVLIPQWRFSAGGFSPIIANGVLYYATNNRILALDAATGTLLWSDAQIGRIHWESPVVANGILYITDESGMLTAYSLEGTLPP
jgi:outer membrane protein assembly factor BamB